jgi:hypothetical protein
MPSRCFVFSSCFMVVFLASDVYGQLKGAYIPYTGYSTPTPLSEPTAIVAGPDGALWFTEFSGNNIGRITVEGAITEFPFQRRTLDSVESPLVPTVLFGLRRGSRAKSAASRLRASLPSILFPPAAPARAGLPQGPTVLFGLLSIRRVRSAESTLLVA